MAFFGLESGYLSEGFRVGQGYQQGDPISPYLFLFGADILPLLILINPEIVGFKFKSCMYKLTQFVDDITLILVSSVSSLQAVLNTLEIFGNFSGLRMNREKTKVIWIGRKKHSKDKLTIPVDLDWGKSEFRLGITFHVELSNMPELNLQNTLDKANIELIKWQSRQLVK